MATDAAEVQLIPAEELAPGQIGAIRNELKKRVLQLACTECNIEASRMIVRDIRPDTDMGFSYEDWRETTGATADAWETMDTGTMADQRWVVIYGLIDDADNRSCSSLKFNVGGADRVIWTLQHLNAEFGCVGISPGGVVIPQNAPYTIYRWVRSVNSTTQIVLKGFVIEPRGKVISP